MIRPQHALPFLLFVGTAWHAHAADVWQATHMLSPGDLIRTGDVEIKPLETDVVGTFSIDRTPVGMEAKHRILAGRPVMDRDVGRHSLVKANSPVRILWHSGGISMEMDGRSLQDGAAGDMVRALNTTSSRTLQGVVQPDGTIQVGGGQ